jgi:pimeloyl-ACP methyl ester carboxylesterase
MVFGSDRRSIKKTHDWMRHRRARPLLAILLCVAGTAGAHAQTRSMTQDPALNNLRHDPGVVTAAPDALGGTVKVGTGPRAVILIPGLGFGGGIWTEFMERHAADYTMFAVTLPGFGGTNPWPLPADTSSFAARPWFDNAVKAITALMDRERLTRVTLVAHWAFATQVALRLALDQPDRIDGVILAGGPLKSYFSGVPNMHAWTAAQRVAYADGMAQKWFRTVTRRTWDDNNFMTYDYAIHPLRALFLWREAQTPTLPVWIRYLLEFYSIDLSPELGALRVPVLVIQPGFDDGGFFIDQRDYMRDFCLGSWEGAAGRSSRLQFAIVPRSRLFVMLDAPQAFDGLVRTFIGQLRR